MKKSKISINYLTKVAILGAMARLVMFFEFPLPIFPGFLKLDFSDLVPLIGGLAMGPLAGVLIEFVKCLIHVINSSTGGVGDLANFIVGGAYVAITAWYYQRHRTKKGAIIGMILGVVAMIVAGAVVNYYITIPLYAIVLGLQTESIVSMGAAITPLIHDKLSLILFAFCPFNLLKGVIMTLIALPLYKKVSPLLQKGLLS